MKTLIATAMVALAAGHYGTESVTPVETHAVSSAQPSPRPTTTLQLTGADNRSAEANQAIADDVEAAATHIDHALEQAPHMATAMARSIGDHGPVRAILYEDPEVKAAADGFAASLGRGLRSLADAIAKDMTEGAKQIHSAPG